MESPPHDRDAHEPPEAGGSHAHDEPPAQGDPLFDELPPRTMADSMRDHPSESPEPDPTPTPSVPTGTSAVPHSTLDPEPDPEADPAPTPTVPTGTSAVPHSTLGTEPEAERETAPAARRPWWDVEEVDDEPRPAPQRTPAGGRNRPIVLTELEDAAPRRSGVLVVALIFALALAATFGALWWRQLGTSSEAVSDFLSDSRPDVVQRAESAATLLMNYDSTNLEDVSERLIEISTGNFREDYENVLGGGLGDALKEASASSRGEILEGPDVFFQSSSEAISIMRLRQTTQSNESPEGVSFVYVMKITLIETEDAGWKVDDVAILSQERA